MNMISVHGNISIMFFNKICRSTFRTEYVQYDVGKYLPLQNASTKDTQTNIIIYKYLNGIFVGEKQFFISLSIFLKFISSAMDYLPYFGFSNVESNKRSHSTNK